MSESYACPHCNFSIPELEPRLFSFNAPYGACDECKGLGTKLKIGEALLMPDKDKTILDGGIKTISNDYTIDTIQLTTVCEFYKIDITKPLKDFTRKELDIILYGSKDKIDFKYVSKNGNVRYTSDYYEGIINTLERRYIETTSSWRREWLENFMVESACPVCHGARLNEAVLSVKINKKNIFEVTNFSILELRDFIASLKLTNEQKEISGLVTKEILNRLDFLKNVGLGYLTLSRNAGTLSGGEAQRIRLATQIGSKLSGVLYVLDEPSIGLHQKDNEKLIKALQEMRDLGNTLIVVEHDTDTMLASDFLVDIGPGAGEYGGEVIAAGTPQEVMKNEKSLTGKYLSGIEQIEVPKTRRKGNGKKIKIVKKFDKFKHDKIYYFNFFVHSSNKFLYIW